MQFAIVPEASGVVRVHSVLESPDAPEKYDYTFPGVDLIVIDEESGMALMFSQQGDYLEPTGLVEPPWAVDNLGNTVPTHFEADGNVLSQIVEHKDGNFAYPIVADPAWWDSVKNFFKNASNYVIAKAKSAAKWLGGNSKWLANKVWDSRRTIIRGAKFLAKKTAPGALVLCAVGGGWAYFRSDSRGWVRVGDAVVGCFA